MSEEYTLPRVMQFLQLEWQRNERDRIQWELEKAEMKSRILKLEGDKQQQDRQLSAAQRTIELLKQTGQVQTVDAESEAASNLGSLVQARQYLEECVSDVRTLLEQTGSSSERLEAKGGHFGARSRLLSTLTNFSGEPTAVCSLSGAFFAVGTDEGRVLLWSLDEGLVGSLEVQGRVLGLWTTASLQLVCISTVSATVFEGGALANATETRDPHAQAHEDPPALTPHTTAQLTLSTPAVATAFSESMQLIAISSPEGGVTVYGIDLQVKKTMRVFPESLALAPTCLEFSEQQLLVGYSDGGLLLADPLSGQLVRRIYTPPAQALLSKTSPGVKAIKVAPNGASAIVGNASGDLRVYDLTKGMLKEEVSGAHHAAITSISFGPSNVVTTSADGAVSLWAANIGTLAWYGRLLSHDTLETGGSLCSVWAHNVVAVGGADGLVRAYSMV